VKELLRPDGRRERFDPARLSASIHRAAAAVGQGEELLAEELAALVALVLEEESAGGVPSTRAVRETAERVLMETGHHDVARSYILRGFARGAPVAAPTTAGGELPRVASLGRESLERFDPQRIATGLMVDCGLQNGDANEVATAVERRVRSLRGATVTTATLRQLVAVELIDRGRDDVVPLVHGLGMPATEVEALAAARGGERADAKIGAELLRRYSLARLLDAPVAEAHLSGDLHVDGLCAPGHALGATIDFGEVRRAALPGALAGLVKLVHGLEPALHGPLVLRHVERALAPLLEGRDGSGGAGEAARTLLLALAEAPGARARGAAPKRVLGLGAELPASLAAAIFRRGGEPEAIRARLHSLLVELLEQAVAIAPHVRPPMLRLLVDAGEEERELVPLSAALQPALALGLAEVDHVASEPSALRVVGARVGLNVARLGLLAGRRREGDLLRSLAGLVERGLSVGAALLRQLLQRDAQGVGFLRRLDDLVRELGRDLPLELPGSHAYSLELVPVGVDAAVRAVTERDPAESEGSARLRGELLAQLRAALPAESAATRFELVEAAFPEAELRFGRLDWLAFPRGRDVLGLAHDGAAFRYSFDPAPPAMAMAAAVAGPSLRVSRPSLDVEAP
jgi:hypothetical protein